MSDPFIDLELEADLYTLISHINHLEEKLDAKIPADILRTTSGNPSPNSFWGGVLHNLIMTRATIRTQLEPRRDLIRR